MYTTNHTSVGAVVLGKAGNFGETKVWTACNKVATVTCDKQVGPWPYVYDGGQHTEDGHDTL